MPKNEQLVFDESTHTYRLMPSGTRLPGVSEIISSEFPFKGEGLAVERSRQFGIAVHLAISLEINNTLDYSTVDDSLIPYLDQWKRIYNKIDIFETIPKTEVMLWSKKYMYSGRIDLISENYIIDIKTGQKSPTHRLQVAAYRHLANCNRKEKIKKGLVVYLDGNDNEAKVEEEKPNDWGCFLSILNTFNWKKTEAIK